MLRDRYRFTFKLYEVKNVLNELDKTFQLYGNTKEPELQLPICVLKDFYIRLDSKTKFPALNTKCFFKQAEALSFHVLYMNGMIRTNIETAFINHEINITL